MNVELGAKRLGLLHELIPKAQRVAAFINPNSAIAKPLIREAHAGAFEYWMAVGGRSR
jgi:hypothetical protein